MDSRLVIDIGNTNTVMGLFSGDEIQARWRLTTRKDVTVDEVVIRVHGLMRAEGMDPKSVRGIAIASVVPVVDFAWEQALTRIFGVKPQFLDFQNCCGLKLGYDLPQQIGADRLANVLGAYKLGYSQGIVIDMGTATTFDIFSDYTYWGGVILPGIKSSLRELVRSASKLMDVELRWPQKVIGKTTDSALQAGLLYGSLGAFEFLIEKILREKPMKNPVIIATGGLANLFEKRSKKVNLVESDLTLMGLDYLISNPKIAMKRYSKK